MKPVKTNALNLMNKMLNSMPEKNARTSGSAFRDKLTKQVEEIGSSDLKENTRKELKTKNSDVSSNDKKNTFQKNSKLFHVRKIEKTLNQLNMNEDSNIEMTMESEAWSSTLGETVHLDEMVVKEETLLDLLKETENEKEAVLENDEENVNSHFFFPIIAKNIPRLELKEIPSVEKVISSKTELKHEWISVNQVDSNSEENLTINSSEDIQKILSSEDPTNKVHQEMSKNKTIGSEKKKEFLEFRNSLSIVSEKNEEKMNAINQEKLFLIETEEDHSIKSKSEAFPNHFGKSFSEGEDKKSAILDKPVLNLIDRNLQDIKMRTFHEVVEEKLQPKLETAKLMLEDIRYQMNHSKNQMKVQLKPRELGEMTLDLQIFRGSVVAKIFVENERAKVMIEQNLVHLREAFKDSGTEIKTVEVFVGNGTNFNLNQHNMANSKNSENQMNFTKNQRMYQEMMVSEEEDSVDWGQSEGLNLLA